MDETEGDLSEAVFMVLVDLAQFLVGNGALKTEQLEGMARAFEIQAVQTTVPGKSADCKLAADLSRILLDVAEGDVSRADSVRHPRLRLVRPDEESPDAPE